MEPCEQAFLCPLRAEPGLNPVAVAFVTRVNICKGRHGLLSLGDRITVKT